MANEMVVLVTCPAADSSKLACALVEEALCACVNIVPGIKSVYIWEDKVTQDGEELLIIKTNQSQWESLQSRIKELHSYTLPEMICLPITGGYEPYIEWINGSVGLKSGNNSGKKVTSG